MKIQNFGEINEMKKDLLIIGAGIYSLVVKETAESTGRFGRIAFVDDLAGNAPDGTPVIGTTKELKQLRGTFPCAIVAIGNPSVRRRLLEYAENECGFEIVSLISPGAFVSPSATIDKGCVVEPMVVVHAKVVLGTGCLVSAGAVINHAAKCGKAVHVDCNAVVPGNVSVPDETKVCSCTVFEENNLVK